jgi:hypothetical protein
MKITKLVALAILGLSGCGGRATDNNTARLGNESSVATNAEAGNIAIPKSVEQPLLLKQLLDVAYWQGLARIGQSGQLPVTLHIRSSSPDSVLVEFEHDGLGGGSSSGNWSDRAPGQVRQMYPLPEEMKFTYFVSQDGKEISFRGSLSPLEIEADNYRREEYIRKHGIDLGPNLLGKEPYFTISSTEAGPAVRLECYCDESLIRDGMRVTLQPDERYAAWR